MPAILGRPSTFLLLGILGASSVLAGACSQRSAPQTRAGTRTAPSMIEPSRCDAALRIEVAGTSNIFGAGIADPPAPAGGGGGTAPPCVSFPSTVTNISIRAAGTVQFVRSDDDVHFYRCVGGPPGAFAPPPGPDGGTTWSCAVSPESKTPSYPPEPTSIPAVGSISGISSAEWQRVPHRRLPRRCRARRTTPSGPRLHRES
jgi:hypothetical protein